MRLKGWRVDWRDSRGRGLVEARRGRREARSREECILDDGSRASGQDCLTVDVCG